MIRFPVGLVLVMLSVAARVPRAGDAAPTIAGAGVEVDGPR